MPESQQKSSKVLDRAMFEHLLHICSFFACFGLVFCLIFAGFFLGLFVYVGGGSTFACFKFGLVIHSFWARFCSLYLVFVFTRMLGCVAVV